MTEKIIIQENGINLYVEINNGEINVNSRREISPILTSIPNLTNNTIDRDEEINEIDSLLKSSNGILLIHGMGGLGKTTLAKLYLNKFINNFNHIAWISISESIKEAFVLNDQLRDSLVLDLEKKDNHDDFINSNFSLITNRMRQLEGNNLLIIDNAGQDIESNEILTKISLYPHWKVIVTSRIILKDFTPYKANFLSQNKAKELFLRHYKGKYEESDLGELFNIIGHHTLTIELLARTLEINYKLSVKGIIRHLENEKLSTKDLNIPVETSYSDKEKTIYKHLKSVFQLIELSNDEKKILIQFSILPSIDIKAGILDCFFSEKENPENLPNNLSKLVKKGWLISNERHQFQCHQIIQEIIKDDFPPTFERHGWYFLQLTHALSRFNLENQKDLIPFAEYAIKFSSKILPETNYLNIMLAKIYQRLGYTSKSNSILDEIYENNKASNSQEELSFLLQKAETLLDKGDHNNALNYYKKGLSRADELVKSGNGYVLQLKAAIENKIGEYYIKIENYDKAEAHFLNELHIHQTTQKEVQDGNLKKFKYARCYESIGRVSRLKGDANKCIRFSLKSFALLEEIKQQPNSLDEFLGMSKSGTNAILGMVYSSLAESYQDLKNYPEAASFVIKDIELIKEDIIANPSDVVLKREYIVSHSKLGDISLLMGNTKQALSVFLNANKKFKKLVEDRPDYINLRYYLSISYEKTANAYKKLNDSNNLVNFLNKAIEEGEKVYKTAPNSIPYFQNLIDSISKLEIELAELGFKNEAILLEEKLTVIYENATDAVINPIDKSYNLFLSYNTIGEYYLKEKKDSNLALKFFQSSLYEYPTLKNQNFAGQQRDVLLYSLANNCHLAGVAILNLDKKNKQNEGVALLNEAKSRWNHLYELTKDDTFIMKTKEIDKMIDQLSAKKKWWQFGK